MKFIDITVDGLTRRYKIDANIDFNDVVQEMVDAVLNVEDEVNQDMGLSQIVNEVIHR